MLRGRVAEWGRVERNTEVRDKHQLVAFCTYPNWR